MCMHVDEFWDDPGQGTAIIKAVGDRSLKALVMRDWAEMTSDGALSQWAFAGLAAHAIKAHRGGKVVSGVAVKYEVDFTWMSAFAIRPGFERYGAAAYFSADRTLLMVRWSHGGPDGLEVTPDMSEWEHAKWVWKCSVLVGVTLKDHLVGVHFEVANWLAVATLESLPAEHPVRRLLLPHIYGTPSINAGAAITLAAENGILHHAVALTWPALTEAFVASRAALRAEPFWHDEHLAARGMHGGGETGERAWTADEESELYPWGFEFKQYTGVVENMIRAFIDEHYATDAEVPTSWTNLAKFAVYSNTSSTLYGSFVVQSVCILEWSDLVPSTTDLSPANCYMILYSDDCSLCATTIFETGSRHFLHTCTSESAIAGTRRTSWPF